MKRRCKKCGESKPLTKFHKHGKNRAWKCAVCRNAYKRVYNRQNKQKVINHFGGVCECCGEDRLEFLSIDHINGGGKAHRAARAGNGFYIWLIHNKFISDHPLRVLCYNCNMSLGLLGYCPHKKQTPTAEEEEGPQAKQVSSLAN